MADGASVIEQIHEAAKQGSKSSPVSISSLALPHFVGDIGTLSKPFPEANPPLMEFGFY
jgi:hypothetical protein